jgi:hypothetical protein
MVSAFWSAIAGKLSERWAAILAPAVAFWSFGALAWVDAGAGCQRLTEINTRLANANATASVAALLAVLLLLVGSAIVVQRLTLPVLRLLEGYWPSSVQWVTDWRFRIMLARKAADETAWQQLQIDLEKGELTPRQRAKLAVLEHHRRHRPVRNAELLSTRIGNILRAAETRPHHRYGLDAVVIWPRLWLVMSELARQEILESRRSLDVCVAGFIWSAAFVVFTPLAPWALASVLISAAALYWWIPSRAEVFADLVESAYDLYRVELYRQLRWPLPANPADEVELGQRLTRYLVRGSDKPYPEFTAPR